MSILTRIVVVLVMVASVFLVGLLVPFVTNRDRFEEAYQRERQRAAVAEQNAAENEAQLSAFIAQLNSTIQAQENTISQLGSQVSDQDLTNQQLRAEVVDLQNANEDVRSQLARLSTGLQQATQINQMLQEEVRDRRERMIALQTRNIELNDRNRELGTEVQTLERQVRLLQERNQDLAVQITELGNQLETVQALAPTPAPGGPAEQRGFSPDVVIRGMVTDVQRIGDQLFVALNVGSNDSVREGMQFMIHRDGEFVGNVVITQVDDNISTGRVTLTSGRGEIVPNLQAMAGG